MKTAFLLLTLFALSACSYLPELSTGKPAGWEKTLKQKQQISLWAIKARLGVQTEKQGGTFDLFWNQESENYRIRLIAPFGQGAFKINGNKDSVNVQVNQFISYRSKNPDQLFKEQFGMDLPISSLSSWMLGIPDNRLKVDKAKWDTKGRLFHLVQAGWNIDMSRYQTIGKLQLPHFFVMQRDDRPDLAIRLMVSQWSVDE